MTGTSSNSSSESSVYLTFLLEPFDYELHQHRTKNDDCNPLVNCNDCQEEMALANFVEHQADKNCSPNFLRVVLPSFTPENEATEEIDKMDDEEN